MLQRETLIRQLGQALTERDHHRLCWQQTLLQMAFADRTKKETLEMVRQWLRDVLDGSATVHVKTILEQVEKALGE